MMHRSAAPGAHEQLPEDARQIEAERDRRAGQRGSAGRSGRSFIEPVAAQVPGGLRDPKCVTGGSAPFLRRTASTPSVTICPSRSCILMGIVGFILLLAVREPVGAARRSARPRQREISIRLAIGAGRGRLVRQFLTESLVLASSVAASVSSSLHQLSTATDWPLPQRPGPRAVGRARLAGARVHGRGRADRRACSPVWCLRFRPSASNLNPALKEVRAHGHGRLGRALVMAQVAISMVLIVGATLFVGTLVKLYAVERGFDGDGVLRSQCQEHRAVPSRPRDRRRGRRRRSAQRVAGRPVRQCGAASSGQRQRLDARRSSCRLTRSGPASRRRPSTWSRPAISRRWARRFVAGRDFDDRDGPAAAAGRDRQRELCAPFLRGQVADRTPRDVGQCVLRDRRRRQ